MGKINLYIAFILVFVSWAGMSSCYKEKKKDPVYIDALYRDHFDYKEGTYWIFYDSLTGRTDSLVFKSTQYIAPYSDPTDQQYGYLEKIQTIYKLYDAANDTIITSFFIELDAPNTLLMGDQGIITQNPILTYNYGPEDQCIFLNLYVDNGNTYNNVYCTIRNNPSFYNRKIYLSFDRGFIALQIIYPLPTLSLHLLRSNLKF